MPANPAGGNAGNGGDEGETVEVVAAGRDQFAAVRDEWLAPLVAQIREQAETIGGLRSDLAHAREERDELAAEVELLRGLRPAPAAPVEASAAAVDAPGAGPPRSWVGDALGRLARWRSGRG